MVTESRMHGEGTEERDEAVERPLLVHGRGVSMNIPPARVDRSLNGVYWVGLPDTVQLY